MPKNNLIHAAAFTMILVGGLNWLMLALFGWEIGSLFGGMDSLVSRAIYLLVGLSAVYEIATHKTRCKDCEAMMPKSN